MNTFLILGNQLFQSGHFPSWDKSQTKIFMREDAELCTRFRIHKHKILFFLSAMRKYAFELRGQGYEVHYEKLGEGAKTYEESLANFLKKSNCDELLFFEIEDKFFENLILSLSTQIPGLQTRTLPSPMFLTSRSEFADYLASTKKPFMKTFYESQRRRLKILIDSNGEPAGGRWSFDEENRLALPKNYRAPELAKYEMDEIDLEVAELIEKNFADHPGECFNFWLPTDRKGAEAWLQKFLEERLRDFGPFEDALSKDQPFLNHSVLTPFLNVGLLTPAQVVRQTLKVAAREKLPLNSVEGFIRQVIGWREFVRGIYQNFSKEQEQKNFWNHKRKLSPKWSSGQTGIEPLDDVIRKVQRYGYAHHIERLMVVGSLMLLLEVDPVEAHRWFMEMFIDSSDWVMGPNVFGMALMSDGGIFATKPYICGSNYYKKMGPYKKGGWQEGVDGLYWSFIDRNRSFFLKNPRLSMMVKTLDKMDAVKKKKIFAAARRLREELTFL